MLEKTGILGWACIHPPWHFAKTIFVTVCGLIYLASLLSVLLSSSRFEGNKDQLSSESHKILRGFRSLYLLLCCFSYKQLRHFLPWSKVWTPTRNCNQTVTPSDLIWALSDSVQSSCLAQQTADLSYDVLWSRHFLSSLSGIQGANLLIGARAVAFNLHFQSIFTPDVRDSELGSVQSWPAWSALLLLDSFEQLRELKSRCKRRILRQDQHSVSAASDLLSLPHCQSWLVALPRLRAWFYILCHAGRIRVGILNLPDFLLKCGKWGRLSLVMLLHYSTPRCTPGC